MSWATASGTFRRWRCSEEVIRHSTIEEYEVEHDFPTIGGARCLLNARRVFLRATTAPATVGD